MENADYIESLIDQIIDGDNSSAKDSFGDLMSNKVSSALDARKIELAQKIYNKEPETEEETE